MQPISTNLKIIFFVISLFILIILAIVFIPKWQINSSGIINPARRFEAENEARRTIAQIVGGTAILIGLYFSWRTLESQRKTLMLQHDDLKATREGQITERFTRAIDQLGSIKPDGKPNLEVRLGGIYALERIAKDSPDDNRTVMEVLTAYIRENAPIPSLKITIINRPQADIQAILTILGRRDCINNKYLQDLDLSNTNLYGADLWEANLTGAFLWHSNLGGVILEGANLEVATLERVNLEGVVLERANLKGASLTGANLEGVNLKGANLKDASGLTIEQLCRSETLYQATLCDRCHVGGTLNKCNIDYGLEWDYWEGGTEVDCLQTIKERCPELLEEPKDTTTSI